MSVCPKILLFKTSQSYQITIDWCIEFVFGKIQQCNVLKISKANPSYVRLKPN